MIRGLALVLTLIAAPLGAHPHIFVETALRLVMDAEGRLQGIEVEWRYDELYSLLIFEDYGLDSDYDGELTEDEVARLTGFDLNWMEGFKGDLYMAQGDRPIALGAPEGRSLSVAEGRITTVHWRAVPELDDGPFVLKAYDPTFYTAYDLTGGITVPDGCDLKITPADLDAAYALVEELLYAMPAEEAEMSFPEVGESFADAIEVTCAS